MTNWPSGGYQAGDTPASELKPPPPALSHETREARAIRRQVAEEIAQAIELRQRSDVFGPTAKGALILAAGIAREIGSKEAT